MSSLLLDYEDKKELLAELERRKKARAIAVTIDDDLIKQQLRSLNQPICEYRLRRDEWPMLAVHPVLCDISNHGD